MVLGREARNRIVVAGLAALLAAPGFLIAPADAEVLFSCDSVTGSAVLSPGLVHDPRPQSLSSGPTAPAGPSDLTLASVTVAGVKGNGVSYPSSLSDDGTKVAFWSMATNLDPQASNGAAFVKDLNTGALTLVSSSAAYADVSLSADGTKVAFASFATNLDSRDTDSYSDVYVKDLTTGALTLASITDTGVKGNRDSGGPSLSADGRKVAFGSRSTVLNPRDGGTDTDVYVKNLVTGSLRLASTNDSGSKGNAGSGSPSLSGDGRRVAFQSGATNFDPRATNTTHIYVKDLTTGDITLASTSDTGVRANNVSLEPALSRDGTRVAFDSVASNLDPASVGRGDVYLKDLTTGDITLVPTSDSGVSGDEASGSYGSLSADGTRVGFTSSATNLDPGDTEVDSDVYVKDLGNGNLTLASTSDSGVKGKAGFSSGVPETWNEAISGDGRRVAFASRATNLDPADTDGVIDTYVKTMPSVATSIDISGCTNGNSGTVSVIDLRSYGPRPLGCPSSLGGAAGNDYPDTTPILVGTNPTFTIDWASGPNSYGVAAVKAGPSGSQWRLRLTITANPAHDTPTTNQYLPASGSGATKTRLQGKLDISALDTFNCTSGIDDPLIWLNLTKSGSWIARSG